MMKKLKPGESEEDVLRMAAEFNAERQKNRNFQPAATVVRMDKPPAKSLFAQKREQNRLKGSLIVDKETAKKAIPNADNVENGANLRNNQVLLDEIHENMLGDVRGSKINQNLINNVVGEIVERTDGRVQGHISRNQQRNEHKTNKSSIFAQKFKASNVSCNQMDTDDNKIAMEQSGTSVVIQDENLSKEIHAENASILKQMRKEDILAERQNLLSSLDPALIELLTKKRESKKVTPKPKDNATNPSEPQLLPPTTTLSDSNPAHELLQQSDEGNWLNFNLVEDHKLAWMRDIPAQMSQLKPGHQFNARFDWKGVLLPHTLQELPQSVDERELYLHGEEPDRPGYTLQELFRLARSTVLQQRISAFGAIAGIFSIYNQGFYDQVLTLPISKIFFLLRFGLDDNAPAQLEVVSRALARLCYNETDEVLLDHVHENAYCQWQPTLQVLTDGDDSNDATSVAFLQRYMKLLRTNPKAVSADFDEDQENSDSKMSMDDFQLAETDLINCLLRSNILQRINFILSSVRPENSTVESCLKLLIRIARTNVNVAKQLSQERELMNVILTNFMCKIPQDSNSTQTSFYGHPQHLCLKLMRVLICQHLEIAQQLANEAFIERLKYFLFYRDDMKGKIIRVQIEALRILRCLLLLGIADRELFKQFLPAMRQLLDWHYTHCVFDVGGPALIRQHAAAVLSAIVASGECGVCDLEAQQLLLEPLHNCCCSWLHKATRAASLKDYTQLTLLSTSIYAVDWFSRHGYLGTASFQQCLIKILPEFVCSAGFIACVEQLKRSSIILRHFTDRRNVHAPLPNVGAVLMNDYGPQLIVSDTYPVHLLSNLWALLEPPMENDLKPLFKALLQPAVLEPLAEYLRQLSTRLNRVLASNFFARSELKFVHQLLTTDGLETYLTRTQLLQLVYNYLCCLTTAQAKQMKSIFDRHIFSGKYVDLDAKSLELLQQTCMEIVYSHFIADNKDPTLTLCYTQAPVLMADWPYFELRVILNSYLQNVQQTPAVIYSENQVVRMTFTFVQQLEQQGLQIVSPIEKLMYLMIAFMGPDSQFLEPELHKLLHAQLLDFYTQNLTYNFDFEATFEDKANFEPLYYLFVNHFEAASYGDELFSSLVLLPLAQKYDNKWRRRIWSEHVQAVRFLNCDEKLLIGGLDAYLQPIEDEPSLVKLYGDALQRQLVRPGSIAYTIARHHFNNSQAVQKTKLF
ncbi:GH16071 [Drosophila grimshawi]|uniref:GH16071 n=1 Tax=Drosophila grimshawi TaxID=7222 RepID=B4J332_DROGR|nr:GH16071 [Drosophila grimshawi]